MNAPQRLHGLGQRFWLDNITRNLVTDGTLTRYIKTLSASGLTSNPTIFDQAIEIHDFYDAAEAHMRDIERRAEKRRRQQRRQATHELRLRPPPTPGLFGSRR